MSEETVRMGMRSRAWLCGVGLLWTTTTAVAQDKHEYPECTSKPSDADVEGAIGAFKAGKARYDEGNRERAILYWEDAYRMDCTAHDLLINLATAYELQGNKEQALIALQTYLKRVPESKKKEQVTRRIEQLTSQVEADKKKAAAASTATAPPAGGAPADAHSQPASPSRGGPGAPGDEPPPPSESVQPAKRPLAPLIVAGVGAGVALIGGGMLVVATADVNKYEDECSGRGGCPTPAVAEAANSATQRQKTAGWVAGAGLVVAATGLVWYLVSKPRAQTAALLQHLPTSRFAPAVGRGFAGIELSGSF